MGMLLRWSFRQKEVRTTLRGLLMGIQAGVERAILGGKDIADALDYVEQQLEKLARLIERNLSFLGERDSRIPYISSGNERSARAFHPIRTG